MKTFPLQSLTLIEAQQKQFALVDTICRHFPGSEFLTGGDLGLTPGLARFAQGWRLCSNRGSVFWCMTRLFTRRLRSLLSRWG